MICVVGAETTGPALLLLPPCGGPAFLSCRRPSLARRLVSKVVPPDQLLPTARALGREIADNTASVAVALSRQMMWKMLGADHPMEAHKVDSRGIFTRGKSADVREGVTAFLEKRRPCFVDTISQDMPSYYPWWEPRTYR